MAAELEISMKINRHPVPDELDPITLIYKPVELELNGEGGLKTIARTNRKVDRQYNAQNYDLDEAQFDEKISAKFLSIDINSKDYSDIQGYIRRKKQELGSAQPRNNHEEQTLRKEENIQQTQNSQSKNITATQFVGQGNHSKSKVAMVKQDGLMGVLKGECDKISANNNLKIMVCVTMFKEPLSQLQKTIDGVTSNLMSLMKVGYASHQIGIFVIFDGIEHLHNQFDENGGSYHDNIIPYFKTHMDDFFGIEETKTLDYQYATYLKHKKRMNDYKPENIEAFRKDKNVTITSYGQLLMKKYKKHEAEIQRTIKYLKGESCNVALLYLEGPILEAMEHLYKLSKKYVESRDSTAWVYQGRYQCQIEGQKAASSQTCFMPIFYIFKYRNGQKLSSHCWFFRGFCEEYKPDYCVLLDCGAIPEPEAITRLIMSMESDQQLGGVCGHMRIEENFNEEKICYPMDILSRILNTYIFSIQKCQSCEYDIGHILDKQYESLLNYVHVLPGAFSAYRYKAFGVANQRSKNPQAQNGSQGNENPQAQNGSQGNENSQAQNGSQENNDDILAKYLRQVIKKDYQFADISEANMFLAEDRVLCLLLYCNGYFLRYIPDSYVYVDAQQTLVELLWQRRRWINGSWFALNYVIDHYHDQLKASKHSGCSKFWFQFSIVQARISQLTQYLTPTFQIVWLFIILEHIVQLDDSIGKQIIKSLVMFLYIFLLLLLVFLSLTYNQQIINKVKKSNQSKANTIEEFYFTKFYGISTILGFISLGTVVYTIYLLIAEIILKQRYAEFAEQPDVPQSYYLLLIIISVGSTALPFILSLFVCSGLGGFVRDLWNVARNAIHFFYYQPTYTHLFLIYSFCRIDDLSWGTKGLTVEGEAKQMTSDKHYYKFLFLAKWIITNSLASVILLTFLQMRVALMLQFFILAISVIVCLLALVRGLFASIYHFKAGWYRNIRDKLIADKVNADKRLDYNNTAQGRSVAFNKQLEEFFKVKQNNLQS